MSVVAPRYPEFAMKLKRARLRAGKSQERIAAEVGTSRRHWIRWERGDHLPSPEFLARIAEATGQPDEFAEELAGGDDEESDPVTDLMRALRRVVRDEQRAIAAEQVAP